MESTKRGPAAKRPGGRTAEVTRRVHDAIIGLLIEGGVAACSFTAVAERAGIERSTLYRRFPDKWDAIIDALIAVAAEDVMPDLDGSFPENLLSALRRLAATLESPLGPALIATAAALRSHHAENKPRDYFDRRMEQLAPMFEEAVRRGDLRSEVEREELFSFAAGAIYFRLFVAGRPVDDDFLRTVVSNVCWLYCAPSVAAKVGLPARMA